FQESAHVFADLLGFRRRDYSGKVECCHQADRADRQLRAMLDCVIAQHRNLQAAAAQIHDAAWRSFGAECSQHCLAAKPRLLDRGDNLKANTALPLDATRECAPITRLPGSAGRDGSILRDAELIHDFSEVAKRFDTALENVFAKSMAHKHTFA